jgi:O-methyltransferase
MDFTLNLNLVQLITIILFSILGYIVFKLLFSDWSYRIVKPYKWEEAAKGGKVTKDIIKLEKTFVDKVRFYSLWMYLETIKSKNIPGYFAELGVYQGETAKLIHLVDPNRKFVLLDTFDGFSQSDLENETTKGEKYSENNFSDTSVENVRNYLGESENLIFIPGHFPESINDFVKNVNYAFVHIDADLYSPTKEALKYFYPKLSPGGIIIIHDYNHTWDGVRRAVDEFCDENNITFIEVADMQGSVVISKLCLM